MHLWGRILSSVFAVAMSLAFISASAQTSETETPPLVASPEVTTGIASLLPDEEDVPDGLVIFQDGERALEDVTSGFSDPEATAAQFEEWGWQGNVVRAFTVEEGTAADPDGVDGIYVSIHEFGSPEAAAEALEFSAEQHLEQDPVLAEQDAPGLGGTSRALFGEQPYGNEITLYVQQDNVLIRLSANSPEGDPEEVARNLVENVLDSPFFEQ